MKKEPLAIEQLGVEFTKGRVKNYDWSNVAYFPTVCKT